MGKRGRGLVIIMKKEYSKPCVETVTMQPVSPLLSLSVTSEGDDITFGGNSSDQPQDGTGWEESNVKWREFGY